jgi:Leucine-rich repeat (LRR) protein
MTDAQIRIQQFKRQRKSHLDLSGLGLIVIPQEIYSLEGLLSIDLSSNKLINLDSKICELTSLTELNLDFNSIKTLPEKILNLKNLTKLSLQSNPLEPSFASLLKVSPGSLKQTLRDCLDNKKDSKIDDMFGDDVFMDRKKGKKMPDEDFDFDFDESLIPKSGKIHVKSLSNANAKANTLAPKPSLLRKDPKKANLEDLENDLFMNTISASNSKAYLNAYDEDQIRLEEVKISGKLSQGTFLL